MVKNFIVMGFFLCAYGAAGGMQGVATGDQHQPGLLRALGMEQNAKYFITLDANLANISA